MKVENGYVKKKEEELCKYFGYLDDNIEYPKYLEQIILELILEELGIEYSNKENEIEELFNLIPKEIIDKWINTINGLYDRNEKVDYQDIKNEYLAYYFPINTFKIHRLLRDLLQNDLIKVDINIIDIGCGPGAATIGFLEFYKKIAYILKDTKFNISITLLDEDNEFIRIAERFISKYLNTLPKNLLITMHESVNCKINKEFKLKYSYDYIIISNLLNKSEINTEFGILNFIEEIITSIDPKGSILMIEPGQETQCKLLKTIRNYILNKYSNINLYSPCNNIWGEKKLYKCKCFSNGKFKWNKPYIIKQLIKQGLLKKVNEVSFNYIILRKDGKTKYRIDKYDPNYIMLKDIKDYNGKYVNVKGIVRCVIEKPNYLWVSICDGTDILNEDKHYHISIKLGDNNIRKRYYTIMKSMNIGEKIVAKNVKCERMRKYKDSYLLNIEDKTDIKFNY